VRPVLGPLLDAGAHSAPFSEGCDRHFNEIFDQILAYAAGKPINLINPEVLGQA